MAWVSVKSTATRTGESRPGAATRGGGRGAGVVATVAVGVVAAFGLGIPQPLIAAAATIAMLAVARCAIIDAPEIQP